MSDPQQLSFEVISQEEYFKASVPKGKKVKTEPRNYTTWYDLTTHFGFCTVPRHEEIQKQLDPEKKEYRQVYPSRMVYEIDGMKVCRDCFLREADKG